MSAHQNISNPEEIDLGQLFAMVNRAVRRIIRTFFLVINFYKRKVFLFGGLLLVGVIGGYFLDQMPSSKRYIREVTIEPNFQSTNYIYDFVDQFNGNFRKEEFRKSLGITSDQFEKLVAIEILPLKDYTNVLDYFKDNYGEIKAFDVLRDEDDTFDDVKKYYKLHKLEFIFKGSPVWNEKDSQLFIELLKANPHFSKIQRFAVEELEKSLEETDKTIAYINKYIAKISENKSFGNSKKEESTVFLTNENEIPTVTSLLKQKDKLLEKRNSYKWSLNLKSAIINVVDRGEVLENERSLNKKIVLLPLALVMLVTFLFFFVFLIKWMKNYSLGDA